VVHGDRMPRDGFRGVRPADDDLVDERTATEVGRDPGTMIVVVLVGHETVEGEAQVAGRIELKGAAKSGPLAAVHDDLVQEVVVHVDVAEQGHIAGYSEGAGPTGHAADAKRAAVV